MRLFGYYAWHSFLNQLKKLFRTWVMIFLIVCMVIGGLVGVGASMIADMNGDTEQIEPEEAVESSPETMDIQTAQITELVVGGIILAVLMFEALSADKNGSRIFLPADVNLLFASPMQPQSVLMFRVTTQMGASLLASLYLAFQIPNLVFNLGMSMLAALALIATWCLTLVIGKLLQVLLYTVCSTHIKLKTFLRRGVYGILAVIAGGYLAYWKVSGSEALEAAFDFFNNPVTRYIPVWGWLKGLCVFAMEENLTAVLLCLGAAVAGGGVLAYIIWNVKADFYEDAMAKSEETAELLERAKSEKTVIVKRKKDRSNRLKRDGMHYGAGANMFFFKSLYNRFRFAHFGIFTKTSETYLVAAVGVSILCRFILKTEGLLPVALTLAGLSFFRALGNPLEQDTDMDHFILIPESTWKKLFWSLMGGTANCFLDVLPAMAVAVILLGANPLTALAWIPVIVSVDFFSTTVGAFINLSVPVSAGKIVKQFVQVIFIYFGLLPDIAVISVGLVTNHTAIAMIGASVLNVGLGLLFFALTPLFLEPKDGKKYPMEQKFSGNLQISKSHFSKLGLGCFAILGVASILQVLIVKLFPQWLELPWGVWICTFAPIYLAAVPVGMMIIYSVPARPIQCRSIKIGGYLVLFFIAVFMMYAGNLVGTILTMLLQAAFGISIANPIMNYATGNEVLPKLLFMVILAPVLEEYIFRKQLIDRMHVYGQKLAIITSALMFGLFHGNLSQLFYAFGLGLVFGYVYLKTGKLRYSIGLHMMINFLGGIIGPMFLEHLDFAALKAMDMAAIQGNLPWLIGYVVYAFALLSFALTGLVLLCIKSRGVKFFCAEMELPQGSRFRTVYWNVGMVLLIIACIGLILTTVI